VEFFGVHLVNVILAGLILDLEWSQNGTLPSKVVAAV